MTVSFKPDGYSSVAPYRIVDGADGTIAFLKAVFDAVERRRYTTEDGRITHAEIQIDDTIVMLADRTGDWPALPAHVHIYVPDVDATYRRALAMGAKPIQEPTKKDDPDRRGGVRDAGGTTWWIATQVEP